MFERYGHCGVVLEIDAKTNRIVEAEFTVVTDLANGFLRNLLVDYDLSQGVDPLAELIRQYYLAPSQDAMIVALRSAVQRYMERIHVRRAGKTGVLERQGRDRD